MGNVAHGTQCVDLYLTSNNIKQETILGGMQMCTGLNAV